MLTEPLLNRLAAAVSRAPSADNMQAWALTAAGDAVELALDPARILPTDVQAMFAWVGLGAAVENLVLAAGREGFDAVVDYARLDAAAAARSRDHDPRTAPVVVRLAPKGPHPGITGGQDPDQPGLAEWIDRRQTDRGRFDATPLPPDTVEDLTGAAAGLQAGVHWVAGRAGLAELARLDARSTYIRLEHPPLHDELFDILRFSRRDLERTRYGLEFEGLGVPRALVWLARLLRHRWAMVLVSRLGIGRAIARQLAGRLRAAGAVCLLTALRPGPAGYVEAGRAMERLWLQATARGLAVQPHGVLPQYLTKLEAEPDGFSPRFADVMRAHRAPFDQLFPAARGERPAIVLRIGRPRGRTPRRTLRLPVSAILRVGDPASGRSRP